MDSTQQKKSTSTERMRKHHLKVALNPQKAEAAREKDRLRKAAARKNSVKTADERKAEREYERERKRRQRAARKAAQSLQQDKGDSYHGGL